MAGQIHDDSDDMIAAINVTPLVDIVLVLLIIFMVTAKLIMSPSINIDLPKVSAADATQESPLTIMLSKDSALAVNGEPMTWDELLAKITAIAAVNPSIHAIVSADKEVAHGEFMRLLDTVQTAGITKFSINVETTRGAAPTAR